MPVPLSWVVVALVRFGNGEPGATIQDMQSALRPVGAEVVVRYREMFLVRRPVEAATGSEAERLFVESLRNAPTLSGLRITDVRARRA